MIIKISQELNDYLESLHYESNARADLLSYMVRNGLSDTDGFNKYHNEYVEFHAEYEMVKREMEEKYLKPVIHDDFTWSLNFKTCEVTCNVKE